MENKLNKYNVYIWNNKQCKKYDIKIIKSSEKIKKKTWNNIVIICVYNYYINLLKKINSRNKLISYLSLLFFFYFVLLL